MAWVLTLVMLLGVMPTFTLPAFAANSGDFAELRAAAKTTNHASTATAYMLTGDVTIIDTEQDSSNTAGLFVQEDFVLDLAGFNLTIELSSSVGQHANGIKIANNKTLTVMDSVGTGILTVTNQSTDFGGAGHGAAINTTDSIIVIESGTIIANGGHHGAGIGGGNNTNGGTIIINGGRIVASGGIGAAGIGSSGSINLSFAVPSFTEIKITGNANVTAIGGDSWQGGGSGIGTGGTGSSGSNQPASLGTIDFTGFTGTLTAYGGTGAGIGASQRNGAAIGFGGTQTGAGAEINPTGGLTFHNVTVTQNIGGLITPPSARVSAGTSPSFTVTANPGFVIDTVIVSPGTSLTIPANATMFNFTISSVADDTSVAATFTNLPDFTITGDTGWNMDTVNVITITGNGTYNISMRSGGNNPSQQRIVVDNNVTANITLDSVSINNPTGGSPLTLNSGANVTLTLQGTNTLTAGGNFAGIQTTGATLTIGGTGTLNAIGGQSGAGIGGSLNGSGGTVTINGGEIIARGSRGGAGIGGGEGGNGGTVEINGGTVTASGIREPGGTNINDDGAGIGGGFNGNGGTVTINGGIITAIAGNNANARAIGKGNGSGSDGTVTVDGTFNYWTSASNSDPGSTGILNTFTNDTTTFAGSNNFRYIRLEDTRPSITLTGATPNGTAGTADTTQIVLTFSADPGILMASDIDIGGSPGVIVKGSLSGAGNTRTLAVSSVTTAGDITVSVNNTATHTFTGAINTTVYKDTRIPVTFTAATADGSSGTVTSTKIDLTFDVEPVGLVAGDITITSVTGAATKGALTRNSGTSWSIAISGVSEGNVSVAVAAPSGYAMSGSPITVAVYRQSDANAVDTDKAALTWSLIQGTNTFENNVTANLGTLPTSGASGTTISWLSSNTSVVSNTGAVTRPTFGSGDANVILTATIRKGTVSDTVVFNLTVKEALQTDAQAVAADKAALTWNVIRGTNAAQTDVTANLDTLPLAGANNTTISWLSSNTSVVSNTGVVTRPSFTSGNAAVTLTATITKNAASDTVTFTLTVTRLDQTDTEAVAEAKAALVWDMIRNANALETAVATNLNLPISGAAGTAISWASSNAAVIATNGTVNRPASGSGNAPVTLTATISRGAVTDTVAFNLTVISALAGNLSTASIPVLHPAGLALLVLMLGAAAMRRRRV